MQASTWAVSPAAANCTLQCVSTDDGMSTLCKQVLQQLPRSGIQLLLTVQVGRMIHLALQFDCQPLG